MLWRRSASLMSTTRGSSTIPKSITRKLLAYQIKNVAYQKNSLLLIPPPIYHVLKISECIFFNIIVTNHQMHYIHRYKKLLHQPVLWKLIVIKLNRLRKINPTSSFYKEKYRISIIQKEDDMIHSSLPILIFVLFKLC